MTEVTNKASSVQQGTPGSFAREGVPVALTSREQWVLWREERRSGDATTKIPYQVTGAEAKTNDSTTWTDFETAVEGLASAEGFDGLGYVFSSDDPFCGVDLDGCRNPETEDLAEWANVLVQKFNTYTEVSPSGTGVKLWFKGHNPRGSGGNRKIDEPQISDKKPGVEIYDSGRYFAVTGWHLPDTPSTIEPRQAVVDQFVATFWPAKPASTSTTDTASQTSGVTRCTPASLDVLERARLYVRGIEPAISGAGGHNTTFNVTCTSFSDST